MLKLSRTMVGHAEAICQMLFGHVVGFVSQSALPQKHQDFKVGFGKLCGTHLGGQMQGWKQHLGPDWGQVWPSWALLRYLEATALLLVAKLGDLEGKLGYREVMLKLSWAMLCHVEAIYIYIYQILLGHVVGFASRNHPKNKISSKTLIPHGREAKTQPKITKKHISKKLILMAARG